MDASRKNIGMLYTALQKNAVSASLYYTAVYWHESQKAVSAYFTSKR